MVAINNQGLATTLTEGSVIITASLGSITASGVLTATPLTVQVSVTATDSGGHPLAYHWRATDGMIEDANANSTSWTPADGPGLHFAYVLVSNGAGGYTERRIAVNTDSIGTPLSNPSPVSMAPPPASAVIGDVYRSFIEAGAWDQSQTSLSTSQIHRLVSPTQPPVLF